MNTDRLQQMDPYDFEKLTAKVWESYGYETTVRRQSGDRGIDVEAIRQRPFQQKELIQVKRYNPENSVGAVEVRNYATLYQQDPAADLVVIVTSSQFTSEAERLACDLEVKTVDGSTFVEAIRHSDVEVDTGDSDESSTISSQADTNSKFAVGARVTASDVGSSCPTCGGTAFIVSDDGETVDCVGCGNNYLISGLG